jgi:hypothetical protein
MKRFLRDPLTTGSALIVYLTINVVVGALHHHVPDENTSGLATASISDPELFTPEPTEDDHDDDDEGCVVCSVLHLAQKPPGMIHMDAGIILAGAAPATEPIIRTYPLQSATRSRAPPLS